MATTKFQACVNAYPSVHGIGVHHQPILAQGRAPGANDVGVPKPGRTTGRGGDPRDPKKTRKCRKRRSFKEKLFQLGARSKCLWIPGTCLSHKPCIHWMPFVPSIHCTCLSHTVSSWPDPCCSDTDLFDKRGMRWMPLVLSIHCTCLSHTVSSWPYPCCSDTGLFGKRCMPFVPSIHCTCLSHKQCR